MKDVIGKKIADKSGNKFLVAELTYDSAGYANGYLLKGDSGQKEISLFCIDGYIEA